MKKYLLGCGVLALLLSGCTTVESTQKFNAMGLGTPHEKAVCHTYVEIPGVFLFGLPIVVGSPKGDGEWTAFQWTLNNENAVYMLTKEAKSKGAARVINVNVRRTHDQLIWFPFLSYDTFQASGTGVRSRGAAVNQAARQYDMAP
ncbi:MAG: hypothetical protein IJJ28_03080 [Lentisphaeria bacterium]|nr:hypothetical protein [Lentisphaeria bacterium]